jgi:hypothetical protein
MYRDRQVVAVVPAGRARVLGLLLQHLRSNPLIDAVQLWQNTEIEDDLKWMRTQVDDLVTLVPLDKDEPPRVPKQLNTGRFYRHTVDPDTVYIRFDDDIIWIHPDAVPNLVDATLDTPANGLCTFATIWNNAIISAIMQENGHLDHRYGTITRYCMDDIGWRLPEFGEYVHRVLLEHINNGTTETLYFESLPAEILPRRNNQPRPLRFSVSCFAYTGEEMSKHADQIWHEEEETYMSGQLAEETGRLNTICGNALVSHYSFFTQRPHLDLTDVLNQYHEIANTTYHDQYYRLLGEATPQGTDAC